MRLLGSRAGRLPSRRVRLLLLLLAPSLFILGRPGTAGAQGLESADIYVNIVSPITIQKLQDLDFGSIGAGAAGGSLRVRPDGTVITSGDLGAAGWRSSPR